MDFSLGDPCAQSKERQPSGPNFHTPSEDGPDTITLILVDLKRPLSHSSRYKTTHYYVRTQQRAVKR